MYTYIQLPMVTPAKPYTPLFIEKVWTLANGGQSEGVVNVIVCVCVLCLCPCLCLCL